MFLQKCILDGNHKIILGQANLSCTLQNNWLYFQKCQVEETQRQIVNTPHLKEMKGIEQLNAPFNTRLENKTLGMFILV